VAWQADTTTGYRDLLNKIVQFATSKHVSAAAINSGGTGYVVGDILTITHASALLDCTIEVTSVAAGVIDGIALRNMGAFSNRIASAVVNAGGSGYAVGDILEIEGGTATQKAKAKVATLSGSAVATVTIQDGGGAYSVLPGATGATTNNDPGSGSGTGCTLDLTTQAIVGTTGIAATGGTGSSATFNLTLTDTGWTAVRDWNNYSYNSVDDEKEVVLEGTPTSGDEPYICFRTYYETEGVDDRYGLLLLGMTSFNPGMSIANQANVGPTGTVNPCEPYTDDRAHLTVFNSSQDFWFSFTATKVAGVVKSVGGSTTAYSPFYLGFGNRFGTTVENPYPMFIAGNTTVRNRSPDEGTLYISSFVNPQGPATGISSAVWFWRLTDTSWQEVRNGQGGSIVQSNHTIYPTGESRDSTGSGYKDNIVNEGPFGWFDGICQPYGITATQLLYRTPNSGGDLFFLIPMTLIRTPSTGIEGGTVEDDVHLELDNIFWFSATLTSGSTVTVEDTFTIGSDRYRIFADCHNRERYSFFCMKEA
jgi:hypothetical protein